MDYQKCGQHLVIRLDRGEEVVATVTAIVQKEGIRLANVTGIGAVDRAVVGTYAVAEQTYHKKTVQGDMEIVSLNGTVTEMNGEPYLHLHAVLGDLAGQLTGGHLNEAIISGTGELVLTCMDGVVDRQRDAAVGLNTLNFGV